MLKFIGGILVARWFLGILGVVIGGWNSVLGSEAGRRHSRRCRIASDTVVDTSQNVQPPPWNESSLTPFRPILSSFCYPSRLTLTQSRTIMHLWLLL